MYTYVLRFIQLVLAKYFFTQTSIRPQMISLISGTERRPGKVMSTWETGEGLSDPSHVHVKLLQDFQHIVNSELQEVDVTKLDSLSLKYGFVFEVHIMIT